MKLFGVEKIVLTNAAGGLNPEVSKIQSIEEMESGCWCIHTSHDSRFSGPSTLGLTFFILVQTRWFHDHQRSFIPARALRIQSACRKEWLKHRSKISSHGRCLRSTASGRSKTRFANCNDVIVTSSLKYFFSCGWDGSRSQKWSLYVSIWTMLWGRFWIQLYSMIHGKYDPLGI